MLVDRFTAARPRLLSLAHRLVGSHHDAEDLVQAAWLRVQAADETRIVSLEAWFTTVTTRLCLDHLRARRRRPELPLTTEDPPGGQLAAEEAFLRREDVSRAFLVVLGELSPAQRVAYVLHELFTVPFDEIAAVLDTTPAAARKLASRARARLRPASLRDPIRSVEDPMPVVEAFLAAARGGDLGRLVALMAPDAVRTADPALLPAGAPTTVRGATAVAEETRLFTARIAVAAPLLVDGAPGAVIAPGGRPFALIRFGLRDGLVAAVEIRPYTRGLVRRWAMSAKP